MRLLPTLSVASVLALSVCFSPLQAAQGEATGAEPNLREISAWIRSVETVQSRFQQYNFDGSISHGMIYISRPGRMRMEYDDADALVQVSGGTVAIWDGARAKSAQKYPLMKTPLWNLLREDVDLGRPGAIKAFDHYRDLTRITAYDPDAPQAGRIVFEFDNSKGQIALDGWKTRTATGQSTTVRLRDPEYGIPLSDFLFSIQHEEQRRNSDR